MLLTLSTNHQPADDLGYLLHKHPAKVQTFSLAFGQARVFYPECGADRCTAAMLLEVDPVALVRGKSTGRRDDRERTLDQYVNDRPYVASSMLAVAIAQVFGSALGGRCKDRPHAVDQALPLVARVAAIRCRGGEALVRQLFEPLGYTIGVESRLLDPGFPEWGNADALVLELSATRLLSELLSHLYVLLPVLDNDKHYWIGDDELDKLMRHGEGWLATHPQRELIASRYLRYRRDLIDDALVRLREQDGESVVAIDGESPEDEREEAGERPRSLHEQRHDAIIDVLRRAAVRRVADLGCGEGRLLRELVKCREFDRIIGMDVSYRSLKLASQRLKIERMPAVPRTRLELLHGSLMYRDDRLQTEPKLDAAVLCEVIEHMDPPRLAAMERVVFEHLRPRLIVITTPNREYNDLWESLPAGQFRHRDHRFEWTRAECVAWADKVAARHGYRAEVMPIGGIDPLRGGPSQMVVFTQPMDEPSSHQLLAERNQVSGGVSP